MTVLGDLTIRRLDLALRSARDRLFDAVAGSKRVRRAAWRSMSRQDRLVYCRFDDHDLLVDPGDLVGKTVLERGDFDRRRTDLISKHAQSLVAGRTVLEVGANIGTQTLYFLKGGFDRVVCLEPDPGNLRILHMNLKINDLADRARVLEVGAGEAPGVLVLRREQGNSGGGTLRTDRRPVRIEAEVEVPVVTLDSLFSPDLDFADVGLIWVDTEGFEEEIFKGAQALLARRIPLVFEYSPGFYEPGRGARIAEQIFSAYDRVSLVDDDGFTPITREQMIALKRQSDIFCS